MPELILTLDAGTTGLKCSVFTKSGIVVGACTDPYGVNYGGEGKAEQTAEQFYGAAVQAVRELLPAFDPKDVAVIGLSGTMNGCLPVDEDGNALYPNMIHADTRAAPEVEELRSVIDDETYYTRTANRPAVNYTLPKLLWLRKHEPEVYGKMRTVLNTKDAIYGFLTGNFRRTDYSDASLTGMFRIAEGRWDTELLRELNLRSDILPEVVPSHNTEGRLTKKAAELLGLPAGIPVSMGAGDGSCATHGAGVSLPGEAYCNVGSSAWLAMLADRPSRDPERRVFSFADMDGVHFNICGTVQCGAAAFDWAAEKLLLGHKPEKADFAMLEKAAAGAPVGSRGIFFLPTLMGERTPWWTPDARGTLIGMTPGHGRAEVIRAVYEGVVQALHQCGAVMEENGLRYRSLSLIGGGASSGIWPQMFADAFGLPVTLPAAPRAATSLGAAAAAGVGAGIYASYAEAASFVTKKAELTPDLGKYAAYQDHFKVYRSLYGRICSAYEAISRYQERHV